MVEFPPFFMPMDPILFTVSLAAAAGFALLSLTFALILYWTLQARLRWKRRSERLFQSLDNMTWKADSYRAAMKAAEERFQTIIDMPHGQLDAMRMMRMEEEAKKGIAALCDVAGRFSAKDANR